MILVDTSVLVAYTDKDDPAYERVRHFIDALDEPLLIPVSVIPEVCYLLQRDLGTDIEAEFVASLHRQELLIEQITIPDLGRCTELLRQYADNPIGFVDASLVAIAERLNIRRILTLDVRHFAAICPSHVPAFELLP